MGPKEIYEAIIESGNQKIDMQLDSLSRLYESKRLNLGYIEVYPKMFQKEIPGKEREEIDLVLLTIERDIQLKKDEIKRIQDDESFVRKKLDELVSKI